MADWASLLPELVGRIANCFLATSDLDYYMDFRAVCNNWRSATDDPKNSSEHRFRPRRWFVVDEIFQTSSGSRLLVNTITGRALHKDLPLLRNYIIIATTHGGYFVLADRMAPHAVRILNPFTGHMIRFMAPLPSNRMVDLHAAVSGSSATLILISDGTFEQYMADPSSEYFMVYKAVDTYSASATNWLAVIGGLYANGELGPVGTIPVLIKKIYELLSMFPDNSSDVNMENSLVHPPNKILADTYCLAEFSGEVFVIVLRTHHHMLFKLDIHGEVLEPVKGIGNLAIFVGYRRCFTVDADKFPTVEANCIYYNKSTDSVAFIDICKYDLKEEKEERVSESMVTFNPITHSFTDPPFTIIQILSGYTMDVQDYKLD